MSHEIHLNNHFKTTLNLECIFVFKVIFSFNVIKITIKKLSSKNWALFTQTNVSPVSSKNWDELCWKCDVYNNEYAY